MTVIKKILPSTRKNYNSEVKCFYVLGSRHLISDTT
jgi:hypothetical protein